MKGTGRSPSFIGEIVSDDIFARFYDAKGSPEEGRPDNSTQIDHANLIGPGLVSIGDHSWNKGEDKQQQVTADLFKYLHAPEPPYVSFLRISLSFSVKRGHHNFGRTLSQTKRCNLCK